MYAQGKHLGAGPSTDISQNQQEQIALVKKVSEQVLILVQ